MANQTDAHRCASCGRDLSAGDLSRGTLIAGRYEILSVLGRGGMGVVYEARDSSLEEIVAIKLVREDVGTPELAARFRTEIKLARRVRHRNVCSIFGDGEHDGRLFLCLERIGGIDLKRQLKEHGALKSADAYDVAIQTAEGLGAIHAAGIVHRDLKTANVMRDSEGRVVVMDFGLAKKPSEGNSEGLTQAGRVVGTPDYMSPEQARDEPLSPATDVYSLAIIIYELFTGERPFQGDTPVNALVRRLSEPPPLERAVTLGLPRALVPVLKKALSIAPDQRYPNGAAFAEALRAAPCEDATAKPAIDTDAQTMSAIATTARPAKRGGKVARVVALFVVAGLFLVSRDFGPAPPVTRQASPPQTNQVSSGLLGDRADCLTENEFSELRLRGLDRQGPSYGRLYFRSNLSPEWFYTEVERSGEAWRAFIPKVNKGGGIKEITYYFKVSREGSSEFLKTEPQVARVIAKPSECPSGGLLAAVGHPPGAVSVLSSGGTDLVLPIAEAFGFQTLSAGLKDADPDVRLATAKSLAEMAEEYVRVINEAVTRLGSPDAGDRQQAGNNLEVTARQAVRGTVDALIVSLADKSSQIRRSVATTLGRLGQALARARAALSAALRDADKDVRVSATQAQTAMGSVVTTTLAALKGAEEDEQDEQAGEALTQARENIEDALSAPGVAKK